MNWYAIYTKPGKENMVAGSLIGAGLNVFNPKLKHKKYFRGAYREIIEPLFPCYIFVQFEPVANSWMIRYTRGVKKILGGAETPWIVNNDIIEFIKSNEEDGITLIKHPALQTGVNVRITGGPFEGFTGIFEKYIAGTTRVVLLLAAIEYQAHIVVEDMLLAKAV